MYFPDRIHLQLLSYWRIIRYPALTITIELDPESLKRFKKIIGYKHHHNPKKILQALQLIHAGNEINKANSGLPQTAQPTQLSLFQQPADQAPTITP